MTSFLPLLSRQWARPATCRPLCMPNLRAYSSFPCREEQCESLTFEAVGLRPNIVTALHAAFPNVKRPTEMQARLIRAVMSGGDILLKDQTGTGKSFGLILALLDKSRMRLAAERDAKGSNRQSKLLITSLLIVPHQELAKQLFHWIQRIITAPRTSATPSISLICQLLVRDSHVPPSSQAASLRKEPPHILIATPNALLDMYKNDLDALQLGTLSTVVVDDADYLIPTVPRNTDRGEHETKVRKAKIDRHPKPTVQLLDAIFTRRMFANRFEDDSERDAPCPQLVLASATLRNHLKEYALTEKGWLRKEKMTRVTGSGLVADSSGDEDAEGTILRDLGGTGITHCALVVSADGDIRNISGAVPAVQKGPIKQDAAGEEDPHTLPDILSDADDGFHEDSTAKRYDTEHSPFNPNTLEAIATAFALDVPALALLIIPASGPVKRAAYELRALGVNAQPFNVDSEKGGRDHLLHSPTDNVHINPTLLVSTAATIRGMDLPDLTHVFILGLPEGRILDSYLHMAGRVGRFWRGGKVITVLEEAEEVVQNTKVFVKDDPARMKRILKQLNITAVQFEHFD